MEEGLQTPTPPALRVIGQGSLQHLLAILGTILVILVVKSIFRIIKAVFLLLEPPQKMEAKRGQNRHQKNVSKLFMVNEENQGILVQYQVFLILTGTPLNLSL